MIRHFCNVKQKQRIPYRSMRKNVWGEKQFEQMDIGTTSHLSYIINFAIKVHSLCKTNSKSVKMFSLINGYK